MTKMSTTQAADLSDCVTWLLAALIADGSARTLRGDPRGLAHDVTATCDGRGGVWFEVRAAGRVARVWHNLGSIADVRRVLLCADPFPASRPYRTRVDELELARYGAPYVMADLARALA